MAAGMLPRPGTHAKAKARAIYDRLDAVLDEMSFGVK